MVDHPKVTCRRRISSPPSAELTSESRAAIRFYQLQDRGLTALVGTILAAAAACILLWGEIATVRLVLWSSFVVASGIAAVLVATLDRLQQFANSRGSPRLANLAAGWAGFAIGALVWIDPTAMDDEVTRLWIVALLLASSSGAVAGRAGVNGQGLWTFIPLAAVTFAGLIASDQLLLAGLFAGFAVFMIQNVWETAGMLQEVVLLRQRAQHEAERAAEAALRDPLTGLFNRLALHDYLADVGSTEVTALFIDLDHFKSVNDRHGHAVGDELLIAVAARLNETVRFDDRVARLGGDEFLVLSTSLQTMHDQDQLAQRIVSELEQPFDIGGTEVRISASVGVAVSEGGSDLDLDDLQRQADYALYRAKGDGRSQSVRFDGDMKSDVERVEAMSRDICDAMQNNEMTAWGQPVVDIERGVPVAVELLARWRRPTGSIELPGTFLPAMTGTDQASSLGARMLDELSKVVHHWSDDVSLSTLPVSINVTGWQLAHSGLTDDLRDLIARERVDPSRIMIEVADADSVWRDTLARSELHAVADLGIGLIMDDFGKDDLSIAPLLELPIAAVKLSRTFVAEVVNGDRPEHHLTAVSQLCRELGAIPVAKGVEDLDWQRRLADAGVTTMQGFLYCEPMPLEDLGHWIHRGELRTLAS